MLLVVFTFLVTTYGEATVDGIKDFVTGTSEDDKVHVTGPISVETSWMHRGPRSALGRPPTQQCGEQGYAEWSREIGAVPVGNHFLVTLESETEHDVVLKSVRVVVLDTAPAITELAITCPIGDSWEGYNEVQIRFPRAGPPSIRVLDPEGRRRDRLLMRIPADGRLDLQFWAESRARIVEWEAVLTLVIDGIEREHVLRYGDEPITVSPERRKFRTHLTWWNGRWHAQQP